MLVKTINTANEFQTAMANMGRDYYTYDGYEWMLALFDDLGENVEFDAIGICGDFDELERDEFIEQYDLEERLETPAEDITDDDIQNYLDENTMGAVLDNGDIIFMVF